MSLISAPNLTAKIYESPLYQTMNVGFTDTIFLFGHADGRRLNDPYVVVSMREALRQFNNDADSPLVRAALEVYYAGARDIWLVSVAPMSEYEPSLDNRDAAYYQTYADRLQEAYDALVEWDVSEIVVPLEAPFNSSVDFLGPLAAFCQNSYVTTGAAQLGILGTRGPIDTDDVEAMIADPRIPLLGDMGKWVSIYVGDGLYRFDELPTTHNTSVATTVAAEISQLPLNRGMTYYPLRNINSMVGPRLTKDQINRLAEAKINAVGPNIRGRRGVPFQIVSYTDNTLAPDNSDFWSLTTMRLAARAMDEIRGMGKRRLGTIGYPEFQQEVYNYLTGLLTTDQIRSYDVAFNRDQYELNKVYVDLTLQPYHATREIFVSLTVGPEE